MFLICFQFLTSFCNCLNYYIKLRILRFDRVLNKKQIPLLFSRNIITFRNQIFFLDAATQWLEIKTLFFFCRKYLVVQLFRTNSPGEEETSSLLLRARTIKFAGFSLFVLKNWATTAFSEIAN